MTQFHASRPRALQRRCFAAARRGVTVAVVAGAGVFAWKRFVEPALPDDRVGSHQVDVACFQDLPDLRAPVYRYGADTGKGLVILGDSRVQAGIVRREFEAAGLGPTCVLTGPSAQTLDLLAAAERMEPRHMVICLSPLGVYWEVSDGLQVLLERERDAWTTERIDHRGNERVSVWRRRLLEPLFPRAWHEGWFGDPDPRGAVSMYRALLRPRTKKRRMGDLRKLWERIRELKDQGWRIECLRLPISEQLRAVEEERFDSSLFVGLCRNLGLPYTDCQGLRAPTSDGSHVVAGSAALLSRRIAQGLKLGRASADPAPRGRR